MSGAERIFAILDLFTQAHPMWTSDEINAQLGYSRPTGYRYIKSLVDAGLLHKASAGLYVLGPRIVALDYEMRQSDPVLLASIRVMDELAHKTGLIVVLSTMFGLNFIDVHFASRPSQTLPFKYARGRPRPWFQGAAPKVVMSLLPRPALVRIYEAFGPEIESNGLGANWKEFRKYLNEVRKEGFYLSRGELWSGIGGAAVAIQNAAGEPQAALALAGLTDELERVGPASLKRMLVNASERIKAELP